MSCGLLATPARVARELLQGNTAQVQAWMQSLMGGVGGDGGTRTRTSSLLGLRPRTLPQQGDWRIGVAWKAKRVTWMSRRREPNETHDQGTWYKAEREDWYPWATVEFRTLRHLYSYLVGDTRSTTMEGAACQDAKGWNWQDD